MGITAATCCERALCAGQGEEPLDHRLALGEGRAGRHRTGALLAETQLRAFARIEPNGHQLQIQKDFDDVFLHAFDAGVFVKHAVNLGFANRAAGHGRQQNAS